MTIAPWTEQRERVFLDRYALRDRDGNYLEKDPTDMWLRVAGSLAGDPGEHRQFMQALQGFAFVPAGRILSGAGADQTVTLYNCFVLGVQPDDFNRGRDSRHSIMDTTKAMVEITSRGGGVGINWSILRPSGSYIRGVNGHSSGAVAWMQGADAMVDKIRQGGTRTAALMYILNDWHPDVIQFAEASFLRANHSVAISQDFMQAVALDLLWPSRFPDTTHPAYDRTWNGDIRAWEAEGLPVIVHGTPSARQIWRTLCEMTVQTGNPGLVFLDRANSQSNTGYFERLVATNPCGEQVLPEGGCCNLGAINLMAFERSGHFDYPAFRATVRSAVRMLDRVIDISPDINEAIGDLQRQVRRVGLGTMGLADLMIAMKIRYGSDEGMSLIDQIYSVLRNSAYNASMELARERGPAPALRASEFLDRPFAKRLPSVIRQGIGRWGLRNLTLTNQAPTGTTSILAGVSSGVEPVFASEYVRSDATGKTWVRDKRFGGEDPWLVTAHDISIDDHIRVQAQVQTYMDNAISKTINLPHGSTAADVSSAYHRAWQLDCKGITVFVDGSREGLSVLAPERTSRLSCGDECEVPS